MYYLFRGAGLWFISATQHTPSPSSTIQPPPSHSPRRDVFICKIPYLHQVESNGDCPELILSLSRSWHLETLQHFFNLGIIETHFLMSFLPFPVDYHSMDQFPDWGVRTSVDHSLAKTMKMLVKQLKLTISEIWKLLKATEKHNYVYKRNYWPSVRPWGLCCFYMWLPLTPLCAARRHTQQRTDYSWGLKKVEVQCLVQTPRHLENLYS